MTDHAAGMGSGVKSTAGTEIPVAAAAMGPADRVFDFDRFRNASRFECLDGLRAVCILAVIFHHTPGLRTIAISGRGYLGVDMFFIISGFLIVTLLLREREKHGRISLKHFYIRRALRIFPVFYGLLIGLTAISLAKQRSDFGSTFLRELPFIATYTTNWVPSISASFTWSLSAEEQFYMVWPAVERYLSPRWILVALGVVFVCFQMANFEVPQMLGSDAKFSYFNGIFPPICLGVALAHLLHHRGTYTELVCWIGRPIVAPMMLLVIAIIASIPADIKGFSRLAVHVAMVALLASCLVRVKQPLARLLQWTPLQRIGAVSYGMYLLHEFVLNLVHAMRITNPFATFVAMALLTWLIAEASFRWYETPFLNLKKRWT